MPGLVSKDNSPEDTLSINYQASLIKTLEKNHVEDLSVKKKGGLTANKIQKDMRKECENFKQI